MVKVYGFEVNGKQRQLNTRNYEDYVNIRLALREAWNTKYKSQLGTNYKLRTTPFRAVTNSGDLLSRQNYSCGGPCSVQSRTNVHGIKGHLGSSINNCDNSGIEPANCNVKYVYDSSDYVKYLKQKALIKKNY
jgi:hypothetical protein